MKGKCGLIFEFSKIRPRGVQFFFGVATYFLLLFYKRENQVRTKNPNDSSMEKAVCENYISGSGDQITYQKSTAYEIAPLYARNSFSTSELGMWEHMGHRSDSLLG